MAKMETDIHVDTSVIIDKINKVKKCLLNLEHSLIELSNAKLEIKIK